MLIYTVGTNVAKAKIIEQFNSKDLIIGIPVPA